MNYYRRRENLLESLLRWRRNVFLQAPGGGYVLVSATQYLVALHHFDGSLRGDPVRTERLEQFPASLFDGKGWNAHLLQQLIQPERTIMPDNQPYTALYSFPLRASIRNLTDAELRVFIALATYADEQGVCFPGVRTLADDTGLSTTDVSSGLDGLRNKGLMFYLRHNAVDPITRKIQPNVYGLTPGIVHLKTDSGIQTYMHEFLNQISPSEVAQPESRTRIKNPESETNVSNHHHQPESGAREKDLGRPDAGASGKDYTNQSGDSHSDTQKPDLATPAPNGATSAPAQPEAAPPGSAPPPDMGDLKAYTAALTEIDLEAYANELQYRCDGLQLAKARQLVAVYGVDQCSAAIGLLANQPFGAVKNKSGWLINKLRQGALLPQDGVAQETRRWQHQAEFINRSNGDSA